MGGCTAINVWHTASAAQCICLSVCPFRCVIMHDVPASAAAVIIRLFLAHRVERLACGVQRFGVGAGPLASLGGSRSSGISGCV